MRSRLIPPDMFYIGVKNLSDIDMFLPQILTTATTNICISRQVIEWGINRRVTDALQEDIDNGLYHNEYTHFYICGSNNMITDCTFILTSNGVDTAHIHHECFFND